MSSTAIYALTPRGLELARTLTCPLGADLFAPRTLDGEHEPFDSLPALMADTFPKYDAHVFIAATGIVVRTIAPHIRDKRTDPAVVCLDQKGTHVISLLSGHLGGANDLARQVAGLTGGTAVITTATDTAGLPAVDELARKHGLRFTNLSPAKGVSAALLAGKPVQLHDPENRLGLLGHELFEGANPYAWDEDRPGVWVDWGADGEYTHTFRLYPPALFAGIGCRRGVGADEIEAHLRGVFEDQALSVESLAGIGTIEAKQDEAGLTLAAHGLDVPITYFNNDALGAVEVPNPSPRVRERMGVDSVCEAAAILISSGRLIVQKTSSSRVTVAVAVSSWPGSGRADGNG